MGYLQMCPGADATNPADLTAKRILWLGRDPDNWSQAGAYFKNSLWIGGTSTANAPFTVDSLGDVSINGTLNVGASGAIFASGGALVKIFGGFVSITDSSGTSAIDMNGSPSNGITMYGARPFYTTGTVRADLGFIANGVPGASGTFTSADGKTVTVSGGIITSIR